MQRAAYLIGLVNRDRPTIRSQLLSTTFHFQQVLDVQWRVDHSVRTKYQDQIGEPIFLISIITAGGTGVLVTSSPVQSVLGCALSLVLLLLVSFSVIADGDRPVVLTCRSRSRAHDTKSSSLVVEKSFRTSWRS